MARKQMFRHVLSDGSVCWMQRNGRKYSAIKVSPVVGAEPEILENVDRDTAFEMLILWLNEDVMEIY